MLRRILIEELQEQPLNLQAVVAEVAELVQAPLNEGNNLNVVLENPNRNNDFYEVTIPSYTEDEFKAHFRMQRPTFRALLETIRRRRFCEDEVPLEKKLLFSLWILAKQESFLSVGNLFNIAVSSGHNFFIEIMSVTADLKDEFIKWPENEQRRRTSNFLHEKSGIPGIIGAIDGTHIPMKAPVHNSVDYYNRNSYHSIILQGICNEKKAFIDIFVGMPGRMHDARVFRQCPLFTLMNSNNRPIMESEHLLGDKAYPLLPWLLTPYRDNGHLRRDQTVFNTKLSMVRSLIEQTFGLLKGKWRRLKYLDMTRTDLVPVIVTAACVLHNFVLQQEGEDDDFEVEEYLDEDIGNEIQLYHHNILEAGDRKRDYIASILR